jgi:hypothetical protein
MSQSKIIFSAGIIVVLALILYNIDPSTLEAVTKLKT